MRPFSRPGLFLVFLIALAASLAAALHFGALQIPDRFDPRTPLDVAAEPNFLTGLKLRRARSDPARCFAVLEQSGLQYERVADRNTGPGCDLTHALRLRGGRSVSLSSPTLVSCRAALSFAMWERHALQPAASRRLGSPIATVEHLGSYACRNINTGEGSTRDGRRSRHATADAIDIAGFVREDRTRITVRRDWGGDGAEALFLRDVHAGGCRFFEGVLGPDYNTLHADHFHLEVGGWTFCR
ncbi:hypothetical protein H4CHR_03164 [Variovorax sp. PBS-H4]|uniref:extensin-like domain-containing protein n=1 Tax=Variovorax sp. PBS-H4 TaxID=434008 RepID=UPI00131830AE|nr:extensin family protein [Variovorax sp. PBS-H4]VTU33201.1 hypothetical protein H4CHR_03164 [Variovorax sp. PBS-H4]